MPIKTVFLNFIKKQSQKLACWWISTWIALSVTPIFNYFHFWILINSFPPFIALWLTRFISTCMKCWYIMWKWLPLQHCDMCVCGCAKMFLIINFHQVRGARKFNFNPFFLVIETISIEIFYIKIIACQLCCWSPK